MPTHKPTSKPAKPAPQGALAVTLKRRGRPRTGKNYTSVHISLTHQQHDALLALGGSKWIQDRLEEVAKTATEPLIIGSCNLN